MEELYTTDILQEQKNSMKTSIPPNFKWASQSMPPQSEKEFFPQYEDIPRILKENRDNLEEKKQ